MMKCKIPEVKNADIVFGGGGDVDPEMLAEAKEKGFYNHHNEYNQLFSKLFFGGGKLNIKPGIDEEYKSKVIRYLKATMASFESKHENKAAVCAMLLAEIVDL